MIRTLILLGTIALAALLAFLTISVAIDDGVTVVVVFALLMLVVIVVGALGALTSGDHEE
ncbi:MAG TPA: hypothetical protein VGR10_05095 [Thermoleophilaceae bacterium]|nr:hypothetical protein [Thermoleophilaceae bacterium]